MRRYAHWAAGMIGHFLPAAAYPQGYVWIEQDVSSAAPADAGAGTPDRWVLANVAVRLISAQRISCSSARPRPGAPRTSRRSFLQVKAGNIPA
jgi:hypothetical protein